ncbi:MULTISPECIES: hypothetical protein [unclassified Phyllobacterium]|uniref:hypothetical protein n=1 Tax=unclassified Phyllobacterium TaxID=2638441 RepID=UPI0030129E09
MSGHRYRKLDIAKHTLVKCYDGKMSPGVARMAFIEGPRKRAFTSKRQAARRLPVSWKSGAELSHAFPAYVGGFENCSDG